MHRLKVRFSRLDKGKVIRFDAGDLVALTDAEINKIGAHNVDIISDTVDEHKDVHVAPEIKALVEHLNKDADLHGDDDDPLDMTVIYDGVVTNAEEDDEDLEF